MSKKDIEKQIETLTKLVMNLVKEKKQVSTTTDTKAKKAIKEQQKPTVEYSKVPDILNKMKIDELISRFGIVWNNDTPYKAISRDSIVKFHQDYSIKTYKIYALSYANKDIIIDRQVLAKKPKYLNESIKARIDEITERLNISNDLTPTEKMSQEKINHRITNLQKQLDLLDGRLNDDTDTE